LKLPGCENTLAGLLTQIKSCDSYIIGINRGFEAAFPLVLLVLAAEDDFFTGEVREFAAFLGGVILRSAKDLDANSRTPKPNKTDETDRRLDTAIVQRYGIP